jgi:hypothetical protein
MSLLSAVLALASGRVSSSQDEDTQMDVSRVSDFGFEHVDKANYQSPKPDSILSRASAEDSMLQESPTDKHSPPREREIREAAANEDQDVAEYRTLLQSPHRRSIHNKPTRGLVDPFRWDRTRTDTPEHVTICWRFEHDGVPQDCEMFFGKADHSVQLYYNGFPQVQQGTSWDPADAKRVPRLVDFNIRAMEEGGEFSPCYVLSNGKSGEDIDFHLYVVGMEFEKLRGVKSRRLSAQFPNSPLVNVLAEDNEKDHDDIISHSAMVRHRRRSSLSSENVIAPSYRPGRVSSQDRIPNLMMTPENETGFLT